MLTAEGQAWVAGLMAGALAGVAVVVSDGSQSASVAAGEVRREDREVVVSATFGSEVANFEWLRKALVVDGVEVDVTEEDQGRKAPGSVWVAEAVLALD